MNFETTLTKFMAIGPEEQSYFLQFLDASIEALRQQLDPETRQPGGLCLAMYHSCRRVAFKAKPDPMLGLPVDCRLVSWGTNGAWAVNRAYKLLDGPNELLQQVFEAWPKFSGDLAYPVPPREGYPRQTASVGHPFTEAGDIWRRHQGALDNYQVDGFYTGEYGRLRLELCAYTEAKFSELAEIIRPETTYHPFPKIYLVT